MKEIVKILEEKCDFDNLSKFNCEIKIIQPIENCLNIEWHKKGNEKIAIKFKDNPYIYKIPFHQITMDKERSIYSLATKVFGMSFYLKSQKISKNCPIYCQEEVQVCDYAWFIKNKTLYDINLITQQIDLILQKVKNIQINGDKISEGTIIWIYLSIQYYGQEKFIELFNFLNLPFFRQDITGHNLGITKLGRPVIIDYC